VLIALQLMVGLIISTTSVLALQTVSHDARSEFGE